MILKEEFSKIIDSEEYKAFKEENKDSFLSSIFLDKDGWQFNFFYNNKLITFFIENDIIKTEESEIYEKQEIQELKLEEVKIGLEQAENLMKPEEEITKKIIILQQKESPLWNITYITKSLNILNLKVDAISGKLLEQKTENIMNFKQTQ
jgi:hypothetical protein